MKKLLLLICLWSLATEARPTFASKGLVVSASDLASQAGVRTLQAGGNVVDAAVTTAFALAVTRPYYASLGGGGFLLVRINGEVKALDYRERAPQAAKRDMYLNSSDDEASTVGALAVATPGNVRGLFELHKKYGKRKWKQNLEAAIQLAEKGFALTEEFVRITNMTAKDFSGSGKKFFTNNGKPLKVGETFRQPQLAHALRMIANSGADGFYSGPVAQDIVHTVKAGKGVLSLDDLKKYSVRWMDPLKIKVMGSVVYSMPPPSSGGALLLSEIKMAERLELAAHKSYSADEYHLLGEIMARAFFDRQYIADPVFSTYDVKKLFSPERVSEWANSITLDKKNPIDKAKFEIKEAGNTTHYVVADGDGNAVTATTTVNTDYGSGVFSEKYGINLNNEMDDFTTKPGQPNAFGLTQSELNTVAPLKTPLSSMTPTIVEKDGKLLLALGAPGGPRIINGVFQVIYHVLTTDLDMDQIVQAPRVHHQYSPDKLYHDVTLSPEVVSALNKKGHVTEVKSIARVNAIKLNKDNLLEGAFDNRGEGGAAGY